MFVMSEIKFFKDGVIDGVKFGVVVFGIGNGDVEMGNVVCKIGCFVDWIDNL